MVRGLKRIAVTEEDGCAQTTPSTEHAAAAPQPHILYVLLLPAGWGVLLTLAMNRALALRRVPVPRAPLRPAARLLATSSTCTKGEEGGQAMDQAAMSRKVDPAEAAMRKALEYRERERASLARPAKPDPWAEAAERAVQAKEREKERERKEAEAKEAKIKSQEKAAKALVALGLVGVIGYYLVRSLLPERRVEVQVEEGECGGERAAWRACTKEVEELCSALGVEVRGVWAK